MNKRSTWSAAQFQQETPPCPRLARRSVILDQPSKSFSTPSRSNVQTQIQKITGDPVSSNNTAETQSKSSPKRKIEQLDSQVESKIEYYERLAREQLNLKRLRGSPGKHVLYQQQQQQYSEHIEALQEELAKLRSEADSLQKEKDKSDVVYQQMESQWRDERARYLELETQVNDLEATIRRQAEEMRIVHANHEEKEKRLAEVTQSIHEKSAQLEQDKQQLQSISEQIHAVEQEKQELQQQLETVRESHKKKEQEQQSKIQELQTMLRDELKEGEDFQTAIELRVKRLNSELYEQQNLIDTLQSKLEEVEAKKPKLEQEIEQLRRVVKSQQEIIERLQEELKIERSECAASLTRFQYEQERNSKLNEQLELSKKAQEQCIQELNTIKSEMTDQLLKSQESLIIQKQTQQQELSLLQQQLEVERQNHQVAQKQLLMELEAVHNAHEVEKTLFDDQNMEEEGEVTALEREQYLQSTLADLQKSNNRICNLEKIIRDQEEQIQNVQVELAIYKSEVEKYRAQHIEMKVQLVKMNHAVQEKQMEIDQLEERSTIEQDLNRTLSRLNRGIATAHPMRFMSELNNSLLADRAFSNMYMSPSEAQEEIITLRQELVTKQTELDIMTSRVAEKDNQIELLKRMLQRRKEKTKQHLDEIAKFYESQVANIQSPTSAASSVSMTSPSRVTIRNSVNEPVTPFSALSSPIAMTPTPDVTNKINNNVPRTVASTSIVKRKSSVSSPSVNGNRLLATPASASKIVKKSSSKNLITAKLPSSVKKFSLSTPKSSNIFDPSESHVANSHTENSNNPGTPSITKKSLFSRKNASLSLPTRNGNTPDKSVEEKKGRKTDIRTVFRQLSNNKI